MNSIVTCGNMWLIMWTEHELAVNTKSRKRGRPLERMLDDGDWKWYSYWTAYLLLLLLLLSLWQHLNHTKLNWIKMTTEKEDVCKKRLLVELNVVTRNCSAFQNAQTRWNRTSLLLNWYRGFFLLWSGDKLLCIYCGEEEWGQLIPNPPPHVCVTCVGTSVSL